VKERIMVKKDEEEVIPEFKAPIEPVTPIFVNTFQILTAEQTILIDFGLTAPTYHKPYDVEDNQLGRICMTWQSSEILLGLLRNSISDHKKVLKTQKATTK